MEKKIKKAVTDSGSELEYSDEKPALKNLINIYACFSNQSPEEIVKKYQGKGYGDFKRDLAETINGFLADFQEKFNSYSDEQVLAILRAGAEKVEKIAKEKMKEVREKVGFVM